MTKPPFYHFALCLLLGSAPGLAAEWMDWSAAAELELASDDNVNIAPDDFEENDEHLSARVGLSRALIVGAGQHSNTRLNFSGELEQQLYNEWDDLGRSRVGAAVNLQHKLGLGVTAPRFSAGLSSHLEKVRDSDRDAWHHSFQLGLDRRFNTRLDMGLRAYWRRRDGQQWEAADPELSSKVYDSDHIELSVYSRYSLLPRLRWSLQASYYDGEFDSDCADLLEPGGGSIYGSGGGLAGLGQGPVWEDFGLKALAVDQVFACRWLADGDGYSVLTEFTFMVSTHSSLRLRARYREIELDLGEEYSNTLYALSYRYRF